MWPFLLAFWRFYWLFCYVFSLKGNKQVAAAIAFSLALFSHALNHAMMRLQTALYEVENPPRKFTNLTPGILSAAVALFSCTKFLWLEYLKFCFLLCQHDFKEIYAWAIIMIWLISSFHCLCSFWHSYYWC